MSDSRTTLNEPTHQSPQEIFAQLSRGGSSSGPEFAAVTSAAAGTEDSDYDEVEPDGDSDASFYSEGEDLAEYWDPYLYQLQMKAPNPIRLRCPRVIRDRPHFYGDEYHGAITREETAQLLGSEDGNYLVRKGLSQSGTYSLSFVFGSNVRHYHLHYDEESRQHYVGEKLFEEIDDLVADGLITLYMEANNVEEYLESAHHRKQSTGVSTPLSSPMKEANKSLSFGEGPNQPPTEAAAPPVPPRGARHSALLQESVVGAALLQGSVVATALTGKQTHSHGADDPYGQEPQYDINTQSLFNYHYEKPHNFKLHHYLALPWCDYCRNFMWGLRAQGYKCKDCGYNSHKQCKDIAPHECQPSRVLVKRLYGVDLTTVVKMCNMKVPIVVRDCINEIENRGLDSEGLYRVSGQTADILKIKKHFDQDMCVNFSQFDDVNCITGAMKLFIRELPIPLITFDNYDLCLIAARCSTHNETVDTIKVVLSRLPPAHFNTLRFLMRHLFRVSQHKDYNKMDSKNLALVFAPSIMRSTGQQDLSAASKLPLQKKVTEFMISQYNSFFH